MALLIRNAEIVNAEKTFRGDILVEGNTIKKTAGTISPVPGEKIRVLNAEGMQAIPGGIDPHVHMHLPTGAGYSSDDFRTGSRAALMGGTTSIIDFVTPKRGQSLIDALARRTGEAVGCLTDYSFHISPVEWTPSAGEEIRACIAKGMPSFKLYMAYKDAIGIDETAMEQIMKEVALAGGMVTVHCETGDEIDALRARLAEQGHTGPPAHAGSRPPHTESDAVETAIALSAKTACPLYIVHVSAAGSVDGIRKARLRGQEVYGEVCTHHLLLDVALYENTFEKAAPFVLNPPLRSEADRNALWEGLQDGTIQTTGSDHCPFFMHQKENGRTDFRKIANGAGGVEHRMELLYTYGVRTGKITVQQFVDLTSTQAAKRFGMYPQKGVIAEGSDADIVLWDPEAGRTISAGSHHQNSDINIYEGFRTTGQPNTVIRQGSIVVEKGKWRGSPPGSMIRRPVSSFNPAATCR